MDRVFSNFQMDSNFYIMLFLFLLITMIISTLIVVFMIKIQALNSILERAKEIDKAKENRLSFLNSAWNDAIMLNAKLKEELKQFETLKVKFKQAQKIITRFQEKVITQEREHVDEVHRNRTAFDKLRIHHQVLIEHLEKAEEEAFVAKKSCEDLKEKNRILYTEKRELEIKLSEQYKQTIEKIHMMEEHRGELKEEFSELASKIFKGNTKENLRLKAHFSN